MIEDAVDEEVGILRVALTEPPELSGKEQRTSRVVLQGWILLGAVNEQVKVDVIPVFIIRETKARPTVELQQNV